MADHQEADHQVTVVVLALVMVVVLALVIVAALATMMVSVSDPS